MHWSVQLCLVNTVTSNMQMTVVRLFSRGLGLSCYGSRLRYFTAPSVAKTVADPACIHRSLQTWTRPLHDVTPKSICSLVSSSFPRLLIPRQFGTEAVATPVPQLLRYLEKHDPESFEAHQNLASNLSAQLPSLPFDFHLASTGKVQVKEPSWASKVASYLWSWNLKRSRPSNSVRDAVEREYKKEVFLKMACHASELIMTSFLMRHWPALKLLVSSELLNGMQDYIDSKVVQNLLKGRVVTRLGAQVMDATLGDGVPEYVILSQTQFSLFDPVRASCPISEGFTPYWLVIPVKVTLFAGVVLAEDKSQPKKKLRTSARYEKMANQLKMLQDVTGDLEELEGNVQELVFWWARGPMPVRCVDTWHAEPWMLLAVSQHSSLGQLCKGNSAGNGGSQ